VIWYLVLSATFHPQVFTLWLRYADSCVAVACDLRFRVLKFLLD
jgi:hypothetical protein